MKPEWIVWHTAAHGTGDKDYDTTAAQIDQWHRERGWSGIGYHYLLRKSGAIEPGRPLDQKGAHVAGLNDISVGICFSGHGDIAPFTEDQIREGVLLTKNLMRKFGIALDHVIGHREIYKAHLTTTKTCPGNLVDMDRMRALIDGQEAPEGPRVRFSATHPDNTLHMQTVPLQRFLSDIGLYDGKLDGWPGLKTSSAVEALVGYKLKGDPRI